MKKLIMFLLVHINPNAIFCQVADTTLDLNKWGHVSSTSKGVPVGYTISNSAGRPITDTTRSVLLVTGKPPSFTHAVYGYCVRRNGLCVGHLDSRGRLFKLPVRVWGCDNNQNRKR